MSSTTGEAHSFHIDNTSVAEILPIGRAGRKGVMSKAASEDQAWREKWIAGVREGLAESDRREFVSEEDIAAVLNKYRRAHSEKN
jgi:predicted transcriptional regulator